MRFLITGGAGFIGSHLAAHLTHGGHHVLVIDNHVPARQLNGVSYTFGDIRDRRSLAPLFSQIDGVFHLAAVVGFANVMAKMRETITTNTVGTELVLHYAQLTKVPVLLASTSACYGRTTNGGAMVRETQDGVLGPTKTTSWAYAYAKAVDEALAFAYHAEYGLPIVVARIFNTVGPGQSAEAGFVLPRFVRAALSNQPLHVHEPGTQMRTFAHVDDVSGMLAALMHAGIAGKATGELVNVGGKERVSMMDLAQRVVAMACSTSPIVLRPAPYGPGYDNVTDRAPDLWKLEELTGLRPVLTLDDMIRDVLLEHLGALREAA